MNIRLLSLLLLFISNGLFAQLKSPDEFLGYPLGSKFTPHYKTVNYFNQAAASMPQMMKLEKYGADFLKAIGRYCAINQLQSRIELKSPKRERKVRTKRDKSGEDTYTISLKMFKSGRSTDEIAAERSMVKSTIETHLVRFIPSGEIKLEDLVPAHKIEKIRDAIIELNAETGIGQVKEFLGEDYTYGEIRAVAAEFLRNS